MERPSIVGNVAAFRLSESVDTTPDRELIARTLGGDGTAYRILVERFQRKIFRIAFAIDTKPPLMTTASSPAAGSTTPDPSRNRPPGQIVPAAFFCDVSRPSEYVSIVTDPFGSVTVTVPVNVDAFIA